MKLALVDNNIGNTITDFAEIKEVAIRGHGIKTEEAKKFISEEIDNYHSEDEFDYSCEIVGGVEKAWSADRFFEGVDAHDDNFSYWISYHDSWKKGLGKCTVFKIKVIKKERGGQ